jgi:hypothetical protein
MLKKYLLAYLGLGLMATFAASTTYKLYLYQNSVVDGKNLKAGHYKVELENNMVVLKNGKNTIELPAKAENSPTKYATTELEYLDNTTLQEIRIGGSHTRIIFTAPNARVAGGE